MTSTISESAKAKDRNYYYHKSETEFDEWTARIQALAGKAKVKRMMVLGEHDSADVRKKKNDDDDKKQAIIDAGNTVFDLLIEHIACAKLVATLRRLYANENTFVFQGHEAFMHIKMHWKDLSTEPVVESRARDYEKEKAKPLSEWPDKKEIETALDAMDAIRTELENTKRKIDDERYCLDIKGKFETCAEDVYRSVNAEWTIIKSDKRLADKPDMVTTGLTTAAAEATKRERAREAARPGMQARRVAGEKGAEPNVDVAEMIEKAVSEATKRAFAAGVESGRSSRNARNPPWTRGAGKEQEDKEPCATCGKPHPGLCWEDPDNADKIDFDRLPPKLRDVARKVSHQALIKKAKGTDAKASKEMPAAIKKKTSFMVRREGTDSARMDVGEIALNVDSGARSGHYLRDPRLFPDGIDRTSAARVQVADGVYAFSIGRGIARFEIKDDAGEWVEVSLSGAYLMGESWADNLFSVGVARSKGCELMLGTTCAFLRTPDRITLPIRVLDEGTESEAYELVARPMRAGNESAFWSATQVPHTRGLSKEMHATETEKMEIWSARMGYIGSDRVRRLPDYTKSAPKILSSIPNRKCLAPDENRTTGTFAKGKSVMNMAGPTDGEWANDIWDAGCDGVVTGARYADFFWGIGNGVTIMYPMKVKSEHPTMLKRFLADVAQLNEAGVSAIRVRKVQPDNEAVLGSERVRSILLEEKIMFATSAEYEPWQNPAENACRIIPAMIRSCMVACGASDEYWEVIGPAMCKVQCRAPASDGTAPPLVKLGAGMGNVNMLKAVGCRAIVRVPPGKRYGKLADQAVECIHFGESTYKLGWTFQVGPGGPDAGRWFTSSQAVFFETEFPMLEHGRPRVSKGLPEETVIGDDDSEDDDVVTVQEEADGTEEATIEIHTDDDDDDDDYDDDDGDDDDEANGDGGTQDKAASPTIGQRLSRRPVQTNRGREVAGVLGAEHTQTAHPHAGRRGAGLSAMRCWGELDATGFDEAWTAHRAKVASAYDASVKEKQQASMLSGVPFKPHDIKHLKAEDQERCETARDKEWAKLIDNETFEPGEGKSVTELREAGETPLNMGEVLKQKRDGTMKDRAYVQGCCQSPFDFDLTYAPTLSYAAFRLFLAIAAVYCTSFFSIDFVSAYTQSILPESERVWVVPPKRWRKYLNGVPLARRLQRSLYGLKQAGKNWYDKLSGWLLQYGFTQCFSEPCLYILRIGIFFVIIAVYVDDLPLGTNNEALGKQVIEDMIKGGFRLTWEHGLYDMLGTEILHRDDCIILHNTKYLNNAFDRYAGAMTELEEKTRNPKIFATPCQEDLGGLVRAAKETKKDRDVDPALCKEFQVLIGLLLYACVVCNPDALFAVCLLSQVNSCPTEELFERAVAILVYFKKRGPMGIPFWRTKAKSTVRGLFEAARRQ